VIPYIFKEAIVCSFRMMVMVSFSNIFGNHLPDYCSILQNLTVQNLNGADFCFQVIFQLFMTAMTEVSCVH